MVIYCFPDKELSDVKEALENIHRKTLQHFPLNPLQKNTRIPFEMFNAPLKIREDLEFKRKTHKAGKEREYKEVTNPYDLFEVEDSPAETIYMLGEAGRGKTGQCYQLVQYWVEAKKAQRESKELSKWQQGLLVFDFLFFVSLRHVDKRIHSVVEMICSSAMKNYPQCHDTVRQILTGKLHICKCVIVLDGLDERKQELDIDVSISICIVFITSRHWKFHELAPDINERDRVVEVCGLDDNGIQQVIKKVLVNYFEIDNESTELETKVNEIFKNITDEKYKSIIDIPLLLTASVHLWQSNTLHQGSMTSFYASLLNILIKIAFENSRVEGKPSLGQTRPIGNIPALMRKETKIKDHFETLVALGRVAHDDLVLGIRTIENEHKEDQNEQKPEITQLVFEKEELIGKLGEDMLQFSLDVGLLNQASAPGSFEDENVSINFFHKTIEEFLAALYIVCSDEVSVNSFLLSCSSIKSLMELSNVLMFLVGLQPTLGNTISKHIARIADSDAKIIRYRQGIDDDDEKVELLFNTLCNCAKEMEFSLTQSEVTVKSKQFLVSDVYIVSDSDKWTVEFATKLLQQVNDHIVSLNVYYNDREDYISFTVVEKFLGRTSSLQALYIKDKNRIVPTWRRISPNFSSLIAVSLWDISLTRNAANGMQKAIQSNIKIQSLKLRFVKIEQNTPDRRGIKNIVRTCFSGSNVSVETLMMLNMKKCKQLRVLDITCSDCLLKDITHCKFLVSLKLEDIRVQSADMLQAALSSFTQLQKLFLENISFTNDKRDKMRLDLTACTGIKTLNLTIIHVDSIKISPLSLQDLSISYVSGSLRGLLSILPQCQHLTDISIDSLSDEQDAKLLTDVLPRLTQVREMTYSLGWQLAKKNEGGVGYHSAVSQAVTKMTGLECLKIFCIDMGDLDLTLTPLMTHIKEVCLWTVQMTANSWGEFIASLLTIQHGFNIQLTHTNIDDESVSAVRSSPYFEVKKADWPYLGFRFSKLSS